MTSKKTAQAKRASLPCSSDYAKQFLKDWDRLSNSGRYDMNRLKEVMLLLVSNVGALPPEYKDHELKGNLIGNRECHLAPDILLVYKKEKAELILLLVNTGNHSNLFE